MPEKTIEQVLRDRTGQWMRIPGVVGAAIGRFEDKPCILILASVKAQELRTEIPSIIEGYPVVIEETGMFRALDRQ
ncbi:MAG: hypothetical protein ACYSYV_04705 [Planctomycetota bacterium]|jgi:hypothetical protein